MSWSKLLRLLCVYVRKSSMRPDGPKRGKVKEGKRAFPKYRKNKATFHAVPPARVRPPPATLLPLVHAPGVGPPAPRCPPGAGLARAYRRRPTPAAGPPPPAAASAKRAPPRAATTGGAG